MLRPLSFSRRRVAGVDRREPPECGVHRLDRRQFGERQSPGSPALIDPSTGGSRWSTPATRRTELNRLDTWLRGDGNRRNPGTTADLVAAILFAGLRDGVIVEPLPRVARTPL